jgi:hypothetical protein
VVDGFQVLRFLKWWNRVFVAKVLVSSDSIIKLARRTSHRNQIQMVESVKGNCFLMEVSRNLRFRIEDQRDNQDSGC